MVVWQEEPVSRAHDRARFDCGSPPLNEYLVRYARQNHESGVTKTFVALNPNTPDRVLGYYSMAVASVECEALPPDLQRRLPRYPIPVYRLARLAVARELQGQGLGAELLVAAALRAEAASRSVGGIGLLIDAKDDEAARWYMRFGAVPLVDHELTLLLLFETLTAALESARESS